MNDRAHPPVERLREISTAYWKSQALFTALRLNLFKTMGEKTLSVKELCPALRVEPHGLEPLLVSLAALGLLRQTDRGYSVPEEYRPYLAKEGGKDFSGAIAHMDHLQANWQRLEEAVRSGGPIAFDTEIPEPEIRQKTEQFMAAMESIASTVSRELVRQFPLHGDEEILDLGCGPGTYSRSLLKAHAGARSTVVDTDHVIPITRLHMEEEGLVDRVTFVAGDFLELSFKDSFYDVGLLSNIIHIYPPGQVLTLCQKVHTALRPGGTILINDFFTDETGTRPLWGALFSLNMLLNTQAGTNYRLGQGESLLAKAGFSEIRSKPLCMDAALLIGKKAQ